MSYRFLTVILTTALVAGCGGNTGVQSAPSATESSSNSSISSDPGIVVTGSLDSEPVITIENTSAVVKELQVVDQAVGTGDAVLPTSTVLANYVGVSLSTGQIFESSWGSSPVAFRLDQVIQGWSEGLVGMQIGGRRLLVIPAELAYGDTPPPGSGILPGETLIFVVDIVDFE